MILVEKCVSKKMSCCESSWTFLSFCPPEVPDEHHLQRHQLTRITYSLPIYTIFDERFRPSFPSSTITLRTELTASHLRQDRKSLAAPTKDMRRRRVKTQEAPPRTFSFLSPPMQLNINKRNLIRNHLARLQSEELSAQHPEILESTLVK